VTCSNPATQQRSWCAEACPAALPRDCAANRHKGCDFSGLDLSGKVFSAVKLQGANLKDAKVVGSQFARAEAQGAVLTGGV
jgi:uncharacterized protein YjbI with pentapeptide repeats